MIKHTLVLCVSSAFALLLPLSASAHIISHTLDVSALESDYANQSGSITFTDDGLSCNGVGRVTLFYLADPDTGSPVGFIGSAVSSVQNGTDIDGNSYFSEDNSYIPSNGISYDLVAGYFIDPLEDLSINVSRLQEALIGACTTNKVDTLTFDDPGLDPGTIFTIGTTTYASTSGRSSAQVYFTEDYSDDAYRGIVFEPDNLDVNNDGVEGGYYAGFVLQPTPDNPWDWWGEGTSRGEFLPQDYGTYTFAIVSRNSACMQSYPDITRVSCAPDFLASETVLLDNTPPAPAATSSPSFSDTATTTEGAAPPIPSPPPASLPIVNNGSISITTTPSAPIEPEPVVVQAQVIATPTPSVLPVAEPGKHSIIARAPRAPTAPLAPFATGTSQLAAAEAEDSAITLGFAHWLGIAVAALIAGLLLWSRFVPDKRMR